MYIIVTVVIVALLVLFSLSMYYFDELDNFCKIRNWPIYGHFYTKRFNYIYYNERKLERRYGKICRIIKTLNGITYKAEAAIDHRYRRKPFNVKHYNARVAALSTILFRMFEEGDFIVRNLYLHVGGSAALEKRFVHNGIILSEYKRSVNKGKSALFIATSKIEILSKREQLANIKSI